MFRSSLCKHGIAARELAALLPWSSQTPQASAPGPCPASEGPLAAYGPHLAGEAALRLDHDRAGGTLGVDGGLRAGGAAAALHNAGHAIGAGDFAVVGLHVEELAHIILGKQGCR